MIKVSLIRMDISIYGVNVKSTSWLRSKVARQIFLYLHMKIFQDFDMAEYHVGDTSLIIQAHVYIYIYIVKSL